MSIIVNISGTQSGEQDSYTSSTGAFEGALIAPIQVTLGPGTYSLTDAYSPTTGFADGAQYDAWNFEAGNGDAWVWHWKVLTDDGSDGSTIDSGNYDSHILLDVDYENPGDTFTSEAAAAAFGAATPSQTITLTATTTLDFVVNDYDLSDNAGGVSLVITQTSPACFCTGTLILTDAGEIAVERLALGDFVVTASGERRPVRWIGHRKLDTTGHPDPSSVWPICVSKDAFGDGKPARDLWLSPEHNIAVEGALIPARLLVNGATVVQHARSHVEYWHVELDRHDIVLAEGLEAESYLDTGNRSAFANGGAFIAAHPDFAPKHWKQTCLPLVLEGPQVARTKALLLERAELFGFTLTREADPHIVADGRRIDPIRLNAYSLAFALPADCGEILLCSHTFVPGQTCPDRQDSRKIGVNVKRLQIDGQEIDLDGGLGPHGWNELEREGEHVHRWTKGSASLPANSRLVVVDLDSHGIYWAPSPLGDETIAKASRSA